MLKKSIYVVLIQVIGLMLNFFSVYFIAGNMGAREYSVVGIYSLIASFGISFSQFGIETAMGRNALFWIQQKEYEKVQEYATQAILSRVISLTIYFPFLLVYVLYLNKSNYAGEYVSLFILIAVSAGTSGITDSLKLIVRSMGDYVYAQFIETFNNFAVKIFGIGIYLIYGSTAYLLFYSIMPFCIMFIFLFKCRKLFRWRYVSFKMTIQKVIKFRYLWSRSYLDYFKNYADSALVSFVFNAEILGAYTIFKSFEQIIRSCIEGFYDCLTQEIIKFKNNCDKLYRVELNLKKIKKITLILMCAVLGIYYYNADFFVRILNLTKYPLIKQMLLCVGLSMMLYVFGKTELNIVTSLERPQRLVIYSSIIFLITLISFLPVFYIRTINILLLQRMLLYLCNSLLFIYVLHKKRNIFYKADFTNVF